MDNYCNEIGQKMRSAVKAKLLELGTGGAAGYIDDELPDYVMIMVANKRSKQQMITDLNLFLGEQTELFVTWLHEVLHKLQEVTVSTSSVSRKRKASGKDEAVAASTSSKRDKKSSKQKEKSNRRIGSKGNTPLREVPGQSASSKSNIQQQQHTLSTVSLTDMFAEELLERAKLNPEINTELQISVKGSKLKTKDGLITVEHQSVEETTQITTKSTINEFDIPTISEISSTTVVTTNLQHEIDLMENDDLLLERVNHMKTDNSDGIEKDLAELAEIQRKIHVAKKQLEEMAELDDNDDLLKIRDDDDDDDDDCRVDFNVDIESPMEKNDDRMLLTPSLSPPPPSLSSLHNDDMPDENVNESENRNLETEEPSTPPFPPVVAGMVRPTTKRKSPIIFDRHSDDEIKDKDNDVRGIRRVELPRKNSNRNRWDCEVPHESKRRRLSRTPSLPPVINQQQRTPSPPSLKVAPAAVTNARVRNNDSSALSLSRSNSSVPRRPTIEKRPVHERLGLKVARESRNASNYNNRNQRATSTSSRTARHRSSVSLSKSPPRYRPSERLNQRIRRPQSPNYRRNYPQNHSRRSVDRYNRSAGDNYRRRSSSRPSVSPQHDRKRRESSNEHRFGARERGRERERRINRSRDRDRARNNSRLFQRKSRSLEKRSCSQLSMEQNRSLKQQQHESRKTNSNQSPFRRLSTRSQQLEPQPQPPPKRGRRSNSLTMSTIVSSRTSSMNHTNHNNHEQNRDRESRLLVESNPSLTQRRRVGSRIIVASAPTAATPSVIAPSSSVNTNKKYVGAVSYNDNDGDEDVSDGGGDDSRFNRHQSNTSKSHQKHQQQPPVNSVIKIRPRSPLSPSKQAPKNLLLKAVAEAQRSTIFAATAASAVTTPTKNSKSKTKEPRISASVSKRLGEKINPKIATKSSSSSKAMGTAKTTELYTKSYREKLKNINTVERSPIRSRSGKLTIEMVNGGNNSTDRNEVTKNLTRNVKNELVVGHRSEEDFEYDIKDIIVEDDDDMNHWDEDYIYVPSYAHLQSSLDEDGDEDEENVIRRDLHKQRPDRNVIKNAFSRLNDKVIISTASAEEEDEDADGMHELQTSPIRKTQFVVTLNDDNTLPNLKLKKNLPKRSLSPQPKISLADNVEADEEEDEKEEEQFLLLPQKTIRSTTPTKKSISSRLTEKLEKRPSIRHRLSEKATRALEEAAALKTSYSSSTSANRKSSSQTSSRTSNVSDRQHIITNTKESSRSKPTVASSSKELPEKKSGSHSVKGREEKQNTERKERVDERKGEKEKEKKFHSGGKQTTAGYLMETKIDGKELPTSASASLSSNGGSIASVSSQSHEQHKRKHTPITFDLEDGDDRKNGKATSTNSKKVREENPLDTISISSSISNINSREKKYLPSNDARTEFSSKHHERYHYNRTMMEERRNSTRDDYDHKQDSKLVRRISTRSIGEVQKYENLPASLNIVPIKESGIVNTTYNRNTKSKELCKYHPNCTKTFCDYYHPTALCKSFPNCKFSDKCKYSHPKCKYDAACVNIDCNFSHSTTSRKSHVYESAAPPLSSHVVPVRNYRSISTSSTGEAANAGMSSTGSISSGATMGGNGAFGIQLATAGNGSSISTTVCKFYPNCSKSTCPFYHPKPCRYGKNCINKLDCVFYHHELPPSSKFKWVASVH